MNLLHMIKDWLEGKDLQELFETELKKYKSETITYITSEYVQAVHNDNARRIDELTNYEEDAKVAKFKREGEETVGMLTRKRQYMFILAWCALLVIITVVLIGEYQNGIGECFVALLVIVWVAFRMFNDCRNSQTRIG